MVQSMHMANFGDPVGIMTAIFTQWLREDTGCSWKKLIECMKRCDLTHFAQEMEFALGLVVQGKSGLCLSCMHIREDHFKYHEVWFINEYLFIRPYFYLVLRSHF